jgi:hypothetical protein
MEGTIHKCDKLILSNCVLISAKFERGRSLIRNCAIKTKDGTTQ